MSAWPILTFLFSAYIGLICLLSRQPDLALTDFLSGGNLLAMLFFVALISIVLGRGLPTTANYIVVSSLMAGVVVELGAQSGLIVPLIAVHMFVFYFGIMAGMTPPVSLASFAAAAISGADSELEQ